MMYLTLNRKGVFTDVFVGCRHEQCGEECYREWCGDTERFQTVQLDRHDVETLMAHWQDEADLEVELEFYFAQKPDDDFAVATMTEWGCDLARSYEFFNVPGELEENEDGEFVISAAPH